MLHAAKDYKRGLKAQKKSEVDAMKAHTVQVGPSSSCFTINTHNMTYTEIYTTTTTITTTTTTAGYGRVYGRRGSGEIVRAPYEGAQAGHGGETAPQDARPRAVNGD